MSVVKIKDINKVELINLILEGMFCYYNLYNVVFKFSQFEKFDERRMLNFY